ncbi:unnamed protein product [Cuscuta europaea]|uniref:Amidase domain-containing protein n=1 Tax=Cuscuta europaea TaxID=41803 RepID=A0A9P1E8R0_CUSEU|nr:unnamed protein product [Cuscuta europaea]
MLVDFSLGTDTGGSVRVPASYCGIFGIRPSHGVVSIAGVIPMAQSFDTVGWFARDSSILKKVGEVLLSSQNLHPTRPDQVIIAEDCFKLQDFWGIQSPTAFEKFSKEVIRIYEFKKNHGEWVSTVRPNLGPGITERVWEALKTTNERIDVCLSIKFELKAALSTLLGDGGILVIPTVPGAPPKLQTDPNSLEAFRVKAFSLLSVAGISEFCQEPKTRYFLQWSQRLAIFWFSTSDHRHLIPPRSLCGTG